MRRFLTGGYHFVVDPLTLDDLDRQLVHALQIDGRAPFSRIAAVLGASDRTLARRYRRLRSAGVLRVVGLPQVRPLGHVDWFVRIRCTPDAVTTVAAALARREDTSWVTLTSGATEVTCIIRAHIRSDQDNVLLPKLPRTARITAVTAHCLLRAVAGTSGWPGRTSALNPQQIETLSPQPPTLNGHMELTEADQRLLPVLAADGRAGYPALAAATGWSESTVRRRLDELRRNDVLYFEVEIDPMLFGYATEAVLWLTVAPSELTEVAQALAGHPEIAFAAATTGDPNMIAFTVCADPDALYDYLATRIGALPGVLKVETALIARHIKRAGARLLPMSR
ncbi:AsnC family transcriptional regulator [Nonomuraea sp. NPDC049141]|uniref:Lrp/AsnC family transcriptional regulator n=1 Tax=Nonomuraea sp. NPDC049141 TaxID=3155500 RepID=UPI0033FC56BD